MSSARLARSAFHAAARRATSSAPNAARAVGRRTMASSAEHAASKKSDTPWIVSSHVQLNGTACINEPVNLRRLGLPLSLVQL